jgi:hypothetical protein
VTVRREHDVARLQVAMDDALEVGLLEGFRDLQPEAQRVLPRQGAERKPGPQRLPLHVLHDDAA